MKKITLNMFLTGMLSIVLSHSVMAATDYSLTLSNNVDWNTASWSPSGVPASGDNATVETDNTARFLYLNGNREVENFIRGSGGGTGGLRIYSGSTTGNSSDTLTVTDTFTAAKGLAFRSKNADSPLTVRMGNFMLTNAARVNVGDGDTGLRYVDLKVSGTTTFEGGNTAFEMAGFATTNDTKVDLGHVYFGNTLSGGSPGITINGALRVRSLENAAGSSTGTIRGTGTLVIYGDTPSGTNNVFASAITGGVRVEKTGSNLQIFSGTKSYTGGTEISGGVLGISGGQSGSVLGSGDVLVANGGTLAGSAALILGAGKYTTVEAGGRIAPGADGNASFNILGFNNYNNDANPTAKLLDMAEGSSFEFRLDADGNSDQVFFGYYKPGSVILGNDNVTVNITGTLKEGEVYELFVFKSSGWSGTLVSSGLTGGLQAGTGFDGYIPTFHYDEASYGGTGIISLTVQVIPEPGTAALLFLSLGLGLTLRKRTHRM